MPALYWDAGVLERYEVMLSNVAVTAMKLKRKYTEATNFLQYFVSKFNVFKGMSLFVKNKDLTGKTSGDNTQQNRDLA